MSNLIDRQAAIDAVNEWLKLYVINRTMSNITSIQDILRQLPSAQPDRELIEQLRWERDTAIQQLKDLGYGLGEKPRTDDTISRQAALDALKAHEDYKGYLHGDFEEILEALPSAQRWIPCNERLPEIGQSVLFSVGGMYSAEGCLREDGDWAQFRWDAIQRKDMVGAWKPLPEPYKGEQE